MPNMDVTEQAARDISAYLYTLGENEGWIVAIIRDLRTGN
jgi:hypothetical protein